MTDYADLEIDSAPRWLRGPMGEALHYVYGLIKDGVVAGAKIATTSRFPSGSPVDALTYSISDFQLDQPYNETTDATRARLLDAWATWKLSGTQMGMLKALTTAGYPNALIIERTVGRWWDFQITLSPPFPWDYTLAPFIRWNNGVSVWNGGARYAKFGPDGERERVNALIKKWKPTNTKCVSLQLYLGGTDYVEWIL